MDALHGGSFDEEDLEVIPLLFENNENDNDNPFLSTAITGDEDAMDSIITGLSVPTERQLEDRIMCFVSDFLLRCHFGCTMNLSHFHIVFLHTLTGNDRNG